MFSELCQKVLSTIILSHRIDVLQWSRGKSSSSLTHYSKKKKKEKPRDNQNSFLKKIRYIKKRSKRIIFGNYNILLF